MPAGSRDEKVRAGRNQSLYRDVNERIRDLNERFDAALTASLDWVCECDDGDCNEHLEMTIDEYERLRSHPYRFAVLPEHVHDGVERVVEEHDGYVVVEKLGAAAVVALEQDPRAAEHGDAA